jgi:putative transposase
MPRFGRVIFPGVPHHVTQRGNHRERVFMTDGDPEAYLSLLHAYSRRYGLEIFAYCLMPNHVHLVVVPANADGMHRALQAVHSQYAQRVNRMRSICGHLWQGRYRSCTLDTHHFVNAIRYTELNPVKAGMVQSAEDYAWSSAAAHCGRRIDPLLTLQQCPSVLAGIANWSSWLARGVPDDCTARFQRHERGNLPCGSDEFVAELERSSGCELRLRTRGGQRKA